MSVFYNEFEPYAAAWLRNLGAAGHVPDGVVDERSIADLRPADLVGVVQAHFFAGIGTWAYALRAAGWPDDRPVWTGSTPCQPFSSAGRRQGASDARHLWPAWFALIRELRPGTIFGEQVASKDGLAWLDAVHADLEGAGYAVGSIDLCAAGFGAPHLRQRLFFVAHTDEAGRCQLGSRGVPDIEDASRGNHADRRAASVSVADSDEGRCRTQLGDVRAWEPDDGRRSAADELVDAGCAGRERARSAGEEKLPRGLAEESGRSGTVSVPPASCALGDTRGARGGRDAGALPREETDRRADGRVADLAKSAGAARGAVNGFWADAEWIPCSDGKLRAIEPGTFPLVDGPSPGRVGRLRAYGNGIVAPLAIEFIRAFLAHEQDENEQGDQDG